MSRFRILLVLTCLVASSCGGSSKSTTAPTNPTPPQQPAACSLSTARISFGVTDVGTTPQQSVTIFNVGGDTLRGSVALSTSDEFSIVGPTTFRLLGQQSQSFPVRYAPIWPAAASCTLSTTSAGCSPVVVTGTGITPHPVCFEPSYLIDFPQTDYFRSTDEHLVVKNIGRGTIAGTFTGAVGDFHFVDSPSYSLPSGQAADMLVRFTSTGVGAVACTLQADPPDAVGQCGFVVLRGTGYVSTYGACSAQVTSGPLDFGAVAIGDSLKLPFTIKNQSATYHTNGAFIDRCHDFYGAGPGSFSLAPGATQSGYVIFRPSFVGQHTCAILISCENYGEGTQPGVQSYINCRGVGVAPATGATARRTAIWPRPWQPTRGAR